MAFFLYPHSDLHFALNAPFPRLRVMFSEPDTSQPGVLSVSEVTDACTFAFFAPYKPIGQRRSALPSVNPQTGVVTAPTPGIYLFVVQWGDAYQVARLQVHQEIQGWWFGNSSITTAKDVALAHAQPSLYARFSDDPTGADLVGDITGHGYVTLQSLTTNVFTVDANGRLQGHREGTGTLEGRFLNRTRTLPVSVLDYDRPRQTLENVQLTGLDDAAERCNLLFLSEGFRAEDRGRFDAIVTRMVDGLFSKPRHAPFNLVADRFNVWRAFEPSQDYALTCGFRVNDQDIPGAHLRGFPIPYGNYDPTLRKDLDKYTINELVTRVGLPLRTETRDKAQLLALWTTQSLTDFDPARVDDATVASWKGQTSRGILEAQDTVFGFMLGTRPGDRRGIDFGAPIAPPAADHKDDPTLQPFIARLYEWFRITPPRFLSPDPRRYPPELFDTAGARSTSLSIMRYIAGLQWRVPPHPNIGQTWVPDSSDPFSPSQGLVVLLTQDSANGGTAVVGRLITAMTLNKHRQIPFQYFDDGPLPVMRRAATPPVFMRPDIDDTIDAIAHELGHSFNLGDEYEEFRGNDPRATNLPNTDLADDNIARLAAIYLKGTIQPGGMEMTFETDEIDPLKVKWLTLPRIERSDALIRDSETSAGQIKVTIDRRFIGGWIAAKARHPFAYLRVRDFAARNGQQLPFLADNAHHLAALIIGDIDEAGGTILLGGPSLPPAPFPVFPKGSQLYVPRFNDDGTVRHIVEPPVFDWMMTTHLSLNRDTDITTTNTKEDLPVDIPGFVPPQYAYRVIGVYEGASHAGRRFRPAGSCRMRSLSDDAALGEFCHVCKYLILHRVSPGMHAILDHRYYPTTKSG